MRTFVGMLMVSLFIAHIVCVDIFHNSELGEVFVLFLAGIFFLIWVPFFLNPKVKACKPRRDTNNQTQCSHTTPRETIHDE